LHLRRRGPVLVERLVLRNFKRFEDAEIHFRDGINGIVGNNGTGKSSIVEAILFSLFGVQGTGVQSDYIVSSFAGERAKCEVRLDFQVQGVRYTITRTFRKGGQTLHEARLNMGERLLASGVSEVAGEVGRLCGMGPSDFRNTVYAAQKDLSALLESRPGARKEWFMQALGIEKLKSQSDEALREWIDGTERALEREKNRLAVLSGQGDVSEIPALARELAGIGRMIAEKEAERQRLEEAAGILAEIASLGQAWAALDGRQKQAEADLLRIASAAERLAELAPAVKRFGELEGELAREKEKEERFAELRDRMGRLNAAVQAGKKRLIDLSDQIEAYSAEAPELEALQDVPERLAEARKTVAAFERASFIWESLSGTASLAERIARELAECEGRERTLVAEQAELAGLGERRLELVEMAASRSRMSAECSLRVEALGKERAALTEDWERIRSSGREGICPLCHQTLGDFYPRIEQEYRDRFSRIDRELASVSHTLAACREEEERTRKELEAVDRALERLARVEQALQETRTRKKSLSERLGELERDRAARMQELSILGMTGYSPEAHSQAKKAVEILEVQVQRLQELRFHQESLAALTRERDRLLEEMERELANLRSIEGEIASLQYDPALRKAREDEYRSLMPVRDEALILQERITREPEIRSELDRIGEEREHIESRLASSREDLSRLGFPQAEPASVSARLQELSQEIAQANTRLGILQEKHARLLSIAAEMDKAQEEIDALEKRLILLRITRKTVAEFVLYLAGVIRADIEDEVSRILSWITSGRYDRVIMDEDFTVLVRDIDGDFPVQRYSGGEQDDIAVALRIALSRCLSGLHGVGENMFLVFDEIFGSQDEERRANLLQALRSQEAHFPQIILISHIPEIQGEFAHTLLVEMADDQKSRIVEVS
jgi:exonuclease SbcC